MSKRSAIIFALLAAAGGLVLGGVIGFVWHAPGRPRTWDDACTWLTFAVVLLGLPAALWQLDMQRRQLRAQQRDLRQREQLLERQQADLIGFSCHPGAGLPGSGGQVHMAVVDNGSHRPIRNVVCRIQPNPSQPYGWETAPEVAELSANFPPSTAERPAVADSRREDVRLQIPVSRRSLPRREDEGPVHR